MGGIAGEMVRSLTIPVALLGETVGFLSDDQERALARAVVLAFDLDLPLLQDRA